MATGPARPSKGLSRRNLLRGGAALTVAVFASQGATDAVAVEVGGEGFLDEAELATLRALVDRIVPADTAPGAVRAECAEAIDGLLAAFTVDPPRIYAGAPFSDRGGHPDNEFENFLPLDAYEATAWRLRIEGSRGKPELEFNGPVAGYQQIYRDGLAALDTVAGPTRFAALPAPGRDLVLATSNDPAVAELLDVAVPHTMEFFYGAPEYGGNKDLVAWGFTNFDGDVQPRGYTDEQVSNPDQPGLPELLPPLPNGVSATELNALLPLASPEVMLGVIERSGGTLRGVRAGVRAILDAAE
jgi:hypothetical protein